MGGNIERATAFRTTFHYHVLSARLDLVPGTLLPAAQPANHGHYVILKLRTYAIALVQENDDCRPYIIGRHLHYHHSEEVSM
jgi:hypothetical protein